jgi:hypothetical protein
MDRDLTSSPLHLFIAVEVVVPMKRSTQALALALAAGLIGLGAESASAKIPKLGGILKAGGIVFAVRQFGKEINKVINTALQQRGISYNGATKVVPILSIGTGAYIGAAQVVGAPEQVQDVRAVGQIETRLGDVQGKLMVPTTSSTPGKEIKRVKGVGLGALIDFEI